MDRQRWMDVMNQTEQNVIQLVGIWVFNFSVCLKLFITKYLWKIDKNGCENSFHPTQRHMLMSR